MPNPYDSMVAAYARDHANDDAPMDQAHVDALIDSVIVSTEGPMQPDPTVSPFRVRLLPPDIFAPLPPVKSVLSELDFCVGAPVLVAGYGFSMKTLSLQILALAKAMGLPVWGHFPAGPRLRCIHFDAEQGTRLTSERYQRGANGLGIDWRELDDRLQVVVMPDVRLDSPNAADVYARALEGFDLAIFDSLRAMAPSLDENSSDIRRVLDLLGSASEKTGVVPVVIHHARKPHKDSVGGSKMSVRGSGAIFDACSSVLVFAAEKDKPVRVQHEKARTSGVPHSDFDLVAEDIEQDGDHRWGLRVVAREVDPESLESPDDQRARRHEEIKGQVMDLLAADHGLTKADVVAVRIRRRAPEVRTALRDLESKGIVVKYGKVGAYRLASEVQ